MATETWTEIDWDTFPESDGEPMAETQANAVQMMDLIFALTTLVKNQGRGDLTAVGGNQLMYFNPAYGRDHVAPDVYVILNYPPPPPPSWRTWVEGKFPEIIFEITSPSTADIDVSVEVGKGKRWRYGTLGVKEYYIYDPQGDLNPPLQGFALVGDRLEAMETRPGGSIYSPLLGAELRQVGVYLRVIDPATDEPLLTPDETRSLLNEEVRTRLTAEERLSDETRTRLAAEERLSDETRTRLTVEEKLMDERRARLAAEERAAAMEEALRRALERLGEQAPPA